MVIAVQEHFERALHDERQRLSWIIDAMGVGIWEWNVQTGQTRFNERWAAIIGRTLEELGPASTIQSWLDHVHPEDMEHSKALLQQHFAGKTQSYECEARMRHSDGHWVWVLDRGRVMTWTADGRPEWMFGTHLDITERKRQQQALQRSEQFLKRTGALAGVGGWEFDVASGELSWASQGRRSDGVAIERRRLGLDDIVESFAPQARPVIHAAVERAIACGEGWDLELPFITRRGRHLWVRVVAQVECAQDDGRAVRLVGAFQDVTRLRQLGAELAQQHELLRVTLSSIADAVITTDPTGQVTWLNPVAESLTGWPAGEAAGRVLDDVVHLVDEHGQPLENGFVAACLELGYVNRVGNAPTLVSREQRHVGVELSAAPIRNQAGEVLGAVVVFRDVTEQRRISSELARRATLDALTGLPNRAAWAAELERGVARAHRAGVAACVMFLDLNGFKQVNDTHGHAAGDAVLVEFANRLRGCLRRSDFVARLAGDEFVVLLDRIAKPDFDPAVVARNVLRAMEPEVPADGRLCKRPVLPS